MKLKLLLTFILLVTGAMLLQSVVTLFLGVRESVDRFVAVKTSMVGLAAENLEMRRRTDGAVSLELIPLPEAFCVVLLDNTKVTFWPGDCEYREFLRLHMEQARTTSRFGPSFLGATWRFGTMRDRFVAISAPILDDNGTTLRVLGVLYDLEPIYQRFRKTMWVSLSYLLLNLIIGTTLFYFRIRTYLFRPLDNLVATAEASTPDGLSFFPVSAESGALRRLSTSLDRMVRRMEDDNKELRQTVAALQQANTDLEKSRDIIIRSEKLASVGRLSAGLAHEIGNPLSIIQGYVELLSRGDLSENERADCAVKAAQELDRIKNLIRQLLDFSRKEEAKVDIVPVNELVGEILSLLSVKKMCAGCQFIFAEKAAHDKVMATRDSLQQVLLNCLLNSVDAVKNNPGERRIEVTTRLEKGGGLEHLRIGIMDNGSGVSGEDLGNVFDPFFTTKEVGVGTGLGLFVCYTIVEAMGGTIDLVSRDRGGCEVIVFLPLVEGGGTEDDEQAGKGR